MTEILRANSNLFLKVVPDTDEWIVTLEAIQVPRNLVGHMNFPNAFDKAQGRSGSFLMIHGGCASIGCYAMTNEVIDELWRIVTAAIDKGEERVPVHAFPFRMTEAKLVARESNRWSSFWADLKQGYDAFERTQVPPVISVCDGRYVVGEGSGETGATSAEGRCPPSVAQEP